MSAEEERLMVLKMLEEGKVSAAEAAELLRALGRKAAGPGPEPEVDWPPMWGLRGAGRFRHGVRAFVKEILDSLPFEGGPGAFPFTGRHHRSEEMLEGKFAPQAGAVRLDLRARGRLTLRAWDGPSYKLLVVRRSFGADEPPEAHKHTAEAAGLKRGDDFLEFEAEGVWGQGWTALEVWLPRSLMYSARLHSDHGRIEVEGLSFSNLEARAQYGRVALWDCRADEAALYADNGSVRAQVSAAKLMAQAGNGRVVLAPGRDRSGEYRVRTDHGSVELLLQPGRGVGYRVEAQASLGHVHREEVPELEAEREKSGTVGQSFVGRTRGFDEQPVKVVITAAATRGQVRLLSAGFEGGWGCPGSGAGDGPVGGPEGGPAPGGAGGAPPSGTGTGGGPGSGSGPEPGEPPRGGGEA